MSMRTALRSERGFGVFWLGFSGSVLGDAITRRIRAQCATGDGEVINPSITRSRAAADFRAAPVA